MCGGAVHRLRVALFGAAVLAAGTGLPALADSNAVLVFDASNSMNSRLESGTRLSVLQSAVGRIAPSFASQLNLGLVAFGNRQELSCRDIQTLVPSAPGAAARTAGAVRGISAKGVSALANAVRKAATEISYRERSGSVIVVADSAGVVNCRVNTCELARELKGEAAGLTIDVIAYAAKDTEIANLQCMATATGGSFARAGSSAELGTALTAAFRAATARKAEKRKIELAPPPRPKPAGGALVAAAPSPAQENAGTTNAATSAPPVAEAAPVAAPVAQAAPANDAAGGAAVAADPNAVPPPRPKPGSQVARAAPGSNGGASASSTVNESVFAPTASITGNAEPAAPAAPASANQPTTESVMAPSAGAAPQDRTQPPVTNVTSITPSGAAAAGDTAPSTTGQVSGGQVSGGQGSETATPRVTASGDFQISASPNPGNRTTTLVRRTDQVRTARKQPADNALAPTSAQPAPAGEGRARLSGYVVAGTNPIPSGIAWQIVAPDTGTVVATSTEATPELTVPSGRYEVRAAFGNARRSATIDVKPGSTATADIVLEAGGLQIIPLNAGAQEGAVPVSNTIYPQNDVTNPVAKDTKSGAIIYLNAGTYRVESRYGNAIATATITVQPGKLVKAKINHRAGPAAFRLVPEGGGNPLSGAVWQVRTSDGTVVTESREATPALVFAEGNYDVLVQHGSKTYRSAFVIKPGQSTDVEVIAR